jgi:3'-phosphoadenosine 5'-phosphosulfate sulfotransferase (PAPS reductase)/FAD synthetase
MSAKFDLCKILVGSWVERITKFYKVHLEVYNNQPKIWANHYTKIRS